MKKMKKLKMRKLLHKMVAVGMAGAIMISGLQGSVYIAKGSMIDSLDMLSGSNVSNNVLSNGNIAGGNVSSNELSNDNVSGNELSNDNVLGDKFTDVNVSGNKLLYRHINGYLDTGFEAPRYDKYHSGYAGMVTAIRLPDEYSSVDRGYVTSIKNQGELGTCWSYAAVAAMESYALTHKLVASPLDIDLSEYALAYISYDDTSFVDPLGGTDGDYTRSEDIAASLVFGGNDDMVFKSLSKWAGIVNQADAPDATTINDIVPYTFDREDISYILTGYQTISMLDKELVKQEIMLNGGVSTTYFSGDKYTAGEKGQFLYCYDENSINHAVAIVGWDDSIDRESFTMIDDEGESHTPAGDGAWLIKNSWGTEYGYEGYMWLSYYDTSIASANAVVYKIAPVGTYDNNYQHDGSTCFSFGHYLYSKQYANIFTIQGEADSKQTIDAIAFATTNSDRKYSIQLYKNVDEGMPVQEGKEILTTPVTGTTTYAGYYTVRLPEIIQVSPGDVISVVVSFDEITSLSNSEKVNMFMGDTDSYNVSDKNQSFIYDTTEGFVDLREHEYYGEDEINLCIKLFTNDVEQADMGTPDITKVEQVSMNSISVSWKAVDGATKYKLYKSTTRDGQYLLMYEGIETSAIDSAVQVSEQYFYKVEAIGTEDVVTTSNIEYIIVDIPMISIDSAEYINKSIKLEWNGIEGLDGYKLYRSKNGVDYEELADIESDAVTYTDTTVRYGNMYSYVIRAYVKIGEEIYESLTGSPMQITCELSGTEEFYATANGNEIHFEWVEVEGAEGYALYKEVYTDDDEYEDVHIKDIPAGNDSTTFLDEDVVPGEYVYYAIAPFIYEDGQKKVGTIFYTPVFIMYPALGNIVWSITDDNEILLEWDSYIGENGMCTEYKINIYEKGDEGYNSMFIDHVSGEKQKAVLQEFDPLTGQYVSLNPLKGYYVEVVAYGYLEDLFEQLTSLQESKVPVGGDMIKATYLPVDNVIYTGEVHTPQPSIYFNEILLVKNRDYKLDYENNINAGTGNIIVTGIGTLEGVINISFTIEAKELTSDMIGTLPTYAYTGQAVTPDVAIKDGSSTLVKNKDYTLEYANNIDEGTASVTVHGIGNYKGMLTTSFIIEGKLPDKITSVDNKIDIHQENKWISNISAGTTVDMLLGGINEKENCIIMKNGAAVSGDSLLGTGMKICIMNNESVVISYDIIVTGDNSGDGKINITDMIAVKANILKKKAITGIAWTASDTNGDGKVNITDFIRVKAHILGKSKIEGIIVK